MQLNWYQCRYAIREQKVAITFAVVLIWIPITIVIEIRTRATSCPIGMDLNLTEINILVAQTGTIVQSTGTSNIGRD